MALKVRALSSEGKMTGIRAQLPAGRDLLLRLRQQPEFYLDVIDDPLLPARP